MNLVTKQGMGLRGITRYSYGLYDLTVWGYVFEKHSQPAPGHVTLASYSSKLQSMLSCVCLRDWMCLEQTVELEIIKKSSDFALEVPYSVKLLRACKFEAILCGTGNMGNWMKVRALSFFSKY